MSVDMTVSVDPVAGGGRMRPAPTGTDEAEADLTRTRILDAAFDLFCTRGIRHSSMEEVARRANAARITVYRKFETKDALVDAVVMREFQRYFVQFGEDVRHTESAADRVVVGFVSSLRAFGENPLLSGLLETEPDSVIGSLIGKDGQMIAMVRRFVAGRLAVEQQTGELHAELDVDMVAEMLVRVCASFLAIPTDLVDLRDPAELERIARQFLVPMLDYRPA